MIYDPSREKCRSLYRTNLKTSAPLQKRATEFPLPCTPSIPSHPPKNSDLPAPTDSRVSLHQVPEHTYLVWQFSGNMGKDAEATAESVRKVAEEAVKNDKGGAFAEYVGPDAKYLVAR